MSDPIESAPSLRRPPPAETTTEPTTDPLAEVPDTPAADNTPAPHGDTRKDAADASPIDWRALLDRALVFLSTASNETLGACLLGLGAGTYLILGRVGLVLIGVVGGVTLHATWESHAHGDRGPEKSQELRRRELGVDIAHRVLSWRENRDKSSSEDTDDADLSVKLYSGQQLDFSDFRPETAAALTELTDAVIRDYVKYARARRPSMYLSNAIQVVVQPHHSQRNSLSRLLATDVHCFPHLHVHPPLPQATSRCLCRFRDQVVLPLDHLLLRALQCDACKSGRQCD